MVFSRNPIYSLQFVVFARRLFHRQGSGPDPADKENAACTGGKCQPCGVFLGTLGTLGEDILWKGVSGLKGVFVENFRRAQL